jgi:hypothetical protein
MTLSGGGRKLALTAHVVTSVGWLGAVVAFLALAIAGRASGDAQTVRAAYLAMELLAWSVIVPLSIASLLTGLVQAVGSTWGLLRHYWVLVKLLMTIFAMAVLLAYLQSLGSLADAAARTTLGGGELLGLRTQAVVHASAALVLLLVAVTLSVYKPRGRTRYGARKLARHVGDPAPGGLG